MNAKARVSKAFRAMKDLDIPQDKVKPALKNLLKLYDKNWSLIEAENYRALIDAIFESEEAHATEQSKSSSDNQTAEPSINVVNTQNEDEIEEEETEALARPLKRLRLKYREGQSSSLHRSSNGETQAPLVRPKEEPGQLPEALPLKLNGSQAIVQSPEPNAVNTMVQSHADTCLSLEKRQGKQPKQKSSATPLIKIKDKPMTDDVPLLEVPLAIIRPDLTNGVDSSSRDGMIRVDYHPEPSTQSASSPKTATANEPKSDKLVTLSDENPMDLASSRFGEVKISLSCNLSHQKPDFQIPSLKAVLKSVEEKCLKSYKILDPNFSLMNIMKDMCQTFLDLGSNSDSEPPKTIDVSPAIDLMNKSSALDARGLCFTSVNGSENSYSNMGSPVPILPPTPPHCDKDDNGSQSNAIIVRDQNGTNEEEMNNLSSVLVPDVIRPVHHDITDVAKGQERVLIVLVNGVDDSVPPAFYYIPQNAVFQNANVSFSLARVGDNDCRFTCSGDCLSLPTRCACANGGEFAYTKDGLLTEEVINEFISLNRERKKDCRFFCEECPLEKVKSVDSVESCKGHLVRKIIRECWVKCGCDKQCGNRVVQRGITHNLQVFMTPEGKGWGLRTREDLPKGSFVCEYVGEILTLAELFNREKQSCPVILDAGWSGKGVRKDDDSLCLDATYYGNAARFINHRCYDSNLVEIPVAVETRDHQYYHVAFFTTRQVKAMEELTWDYGIDFDDNVHPIKAFRCQCRSAFCRNIEHFRSRSSRRL